MEENKDLMVTENEEQETVEETEETRGNSGATLLVGALIGAGAYALGRKVVGWWKNRKAKEPEERFIPAEMAAVCVMPCILLRK